MGFRLVTLNLNGIRSAAAKGFLQWGPETGADCMGVQEVRAQHAEVHGRFDQLGRLRGHFHFAEKKGYSGVGIYSRRTPSEVLCGFDGGEFDTEGRFVEARFDTLAPRRGFNRFSVISCYFPSGSSGEHRQAAKYRFLAALYPHLVKLRAEREFILVGDVNIAHHPIDLKNWRSNQKNSGFLPDERAWLTRLFDEAGLVDVFRQLNPHPDQYTWWSNRGNAWANNVGWRLDYHLATPAVAALARAGSDRIFVEQRFSDHAPLTIDYRFTL